MKLSIANMQRGNYEHDELCRRCFVTLDGKNVDLAIEADEEAGYVVQYIPKTDPRFETEYKKVYPERPTEKLYGVVKIVDPQRPAL